MARALRGVRSSALDAPCVAPARLRRGDGEARRAERADDHLRQLVSALARAHALGGGAHQLVGAERGARRPRRELARARLGDSLGERRLVAPARASAQRPMPRVQPAAVALGAARVPAARGAPRAPRRRGRDRPDSPPSRRPGNGLF